MPAPKKCKCHTWASEEQAWMDRYGTIEGSKRWRDWMRNKSKSMHHLACPIGRTKEAEELLQNAGFYLREGCMCGQCAVCDLADEIKAFLLVAHAPT
jgi:hypothetical protein